VSAYCRFCATKQLNIGFCIHLTEVSAVCMGLFWGDSTLRTLHLEPKIGIWNSCQTFIQPTKLLKLVHWITLVTPYIFSRKKIICSQDLWAVNWRRSVADITAKNNHIIHVPFLKLNFLWIEKTWEGHKM